MEDGGGATNKTVPFSSIILRIPSKKKTLMMLKGIYKSGWNRRRRIRRVPSLAVAALR